MKARVARLLALTSLCAAVAAAAPFPLSGCGTSGKALIGDPVAFFAEARESLMAASSLRMSGQGYAEYSGPSGREKMTMQMDMCYEEKEGEESIIKISMSISGEGRQWSSEMPESFELDGYIVGGKAYIEDPYSGRWYCEEQGFGKAMGGIAQGLSTISPETVKANIDAAGEAQVIEEDEKSISYRLVLDPDKYFKPSSVEELREEFRKRGVSEEEIEAKIRALKDLCLVMDYVVEVDKESGLISGFGFTWDEDVIAVMGPMLGGEPLPEGVSAKLSASFRLSDYGKAFGLALPEEAKEATPLEGR